MVIPTWVYRVRRRVSERPPAWASVLARISHQADPEDLAAVAGRAGVRHRNATRCTNRVALARPGTSHSVLLKRAASSVRGVYLLIEFGPKGKHPQLCMYVNALGYAPDRRRRGVVRTVYPRARGGTRARLPAARMLICHTGRANFILCNLQLLLLRMTRTTEPCARIKAHARLLFAQIGH